MPYVRRGMVLALALLASMGEFTSFEVSETQAGDGALLI
jgi:hypothetical protein